MKKYLAGGLALLVLISGVLINFTSAASVGVDFEQTTYVIGNINGQDGWIKTGGYDSAVVDNTYGYTTFDDQSLRISNAVTSGAFGDQTFSKPNSDESGETTAENGGLSGGTRNNYFEASWDFASTVPGAEQPGLSVVASPDRGDGARMSWVQMMDTPTGLEINFYDYQTGLGFVETNVVSDLDRTVPHNIKITMNFVDGVANDVVKVYVDGVLEHTGTSWEDYFRDVEGNPTRTVDSILFRVGGTAAPATLNNGFLIDNLSIEIFNAVATSIPEIISPANGAIVTVSALDKIDWTDSTGTFSPFEYQYQAFSDVTYTTLIYSSGWLTVSEIATPGTPPGDYYVQVRARGNDLVETDWSNDATDPYKITVIADTVPTPTPTPTPTPIPSLTPTDKDECKKGGWMTFNNPVFKNQGDCVSFVVSKKN